MTTPEPAPVRIGFDTPCQPFAFVADGVPCGAMIEAAAAVWTELGVAPEWVPLEHEESEIALLEGTVDVLAFKDVVPARRSVFEYSSSLLRSGAALFVSPEATLASTGDIGRFGGRAVATPRRGMLASLLRTRYPGVPLVLTGSQEEALAAVAEGKADAAALNMHAGTWWIRERFMGAVLMPRRPFLELDLAMATSRRRTDGLMKRIEGALATLRARGVLESLFRERRLV